MEEAGHRILKLNIGNPAPFGFSASDEIIQDVILNLPNAEGYTASRGLFPARKAIMHECQRLDIPGVEIDDIFLRSEERRVGKECRFRGAPGYEKKEQENTTGGRMNTAMQ